MLYGVATFVGSYGGGRNTIAKVYSLAEVDGFVGRVVVVGQLAGGADDAHVVDAIVAEHLLSHFASGHTVTQRDA